MMFKKDPEVIKVLDALIKNLKELDKWKPGDGSTKVEHRAWNIEFNKDSIRKPEYVDIKWRYWNQRKSLKKSITAIYRKAELNKLGFINDVINGVYEHHWHEPLSDEKREWLNENSSGNGDYIYYDYWIYFKDDTLAMAYKLRFE